MYNLIMFYFCMFMAICLFVFFYFQSGFSATVSFAEKAVRKKMGKKCDEKEVRVWTGMKGKCKTRRMSIERRGKRK